MTNQNATFSQKGDSLLFHRCLSPHCPWEGCPHARGACPHKATYLYQIADKTENSRSALQKKHANWGQKNTVFDGKMCFFGLFTQFYGYRQLLANT
jgi:hypothetical protein